MATTLLQPTPPIRRGVNSMGFAQKFIGALEADPHVDADHAAFIGSDGDAVLIRYRGRDLQWQIPVRINEPGWQKMDYITSSFDGVDFGLFLDEELYKLNEKEWIKPELHLSDDTGKWHLVETAKTFT